MAAPANGTCATATAVTLPYTDTLDTTLGATDASVNPSCSGAVDKAVWWTYTNSGAVHRLIAVTATASYDPGVSVWTGTCGSLTEVTCTTFTYDVHTIYLTFAAAPLTAYYIVVCDTELGVGGPLTLTVTGTTITAPTLVTGVSLDEKGEAVMTYLAADGAVGARDASPTVSVPRSLTARASDGHLLAFNGSLYDLSPSLGLLSTTGMSDPNATYLWTPQFLGADLTGQLYVGWSASTPDMAHAVLQRVHPTTFAVLDTWTDFDAAILAVAGGMSVSWGTFSPDGTKFYYGGAGGSGAGQHRVYVYDLVGLGESVFATYGTWSSGTGNLFYVHNMVTFANGDVAVLSHHLTASAIDGATLLIYSSSGTLLHTYPLLEPIASSAYRGLALSTDEATLWVINDAPFLDAYDVATGARTFHFTIPTAGIDLVYVGGAPTPAALATAVAIRRLRRAPHVAQENQRVIYRKFELDLERGQGLATGQGSDPHVLLRISRDGGQTWGEEIRMAAGQLGAYQQRVIARRLGQARDTVFEVTVSDPIAWSLVGAWIDVEPGTN